MTKTRIFSQIPALMISSRRYETQQSLYAFLSLNCNPSSSLLKLIGQLREERQRLARSAAKLPISTRN
jgi:hypothetical protein